MSERGCESSADGLWKGDTAYGGVGGGIMNLFTSDRGYVVYSLISSTIILAYSLTSAIPEIKLRGSGSQNDLNYEHTYKDDIILALLAHPLFYGGM